jgi:hypothetical protein
MKKNKKIFFLVSLPRAGNTIFATLINQNPNLACTAHSIVPKIVENLCLIKTDNTFKNFPDHKSLDNVITSVYKNYYENWRQDYILERTATISDLEFLPKDTKFIILWRDLLDVFASYIKWFEKEPTAFINKTFIESVEGKLLLLMNPEGLLTNSLQAIENILNNVDKNNFHVITYKQLCLHPEKTFKSLYNFLEIKPFKHHFTNLKQFKINGVQYDDTVFGNNLHTINTKIKLNEVYKLENPYRKLIPKNIIEKFGKIKLKKTKKGFVYEKI